MASTALNLLEYFYLWLPCRTPPPSAKVLQVLRNDDATHVPRGYRKLYYSHNEDFWGKQAPKPSWKGVANGFGFCRGWGQGQGEQWLGLHGLSLPPAPREGESPFSCCLAQKWDTTGWRRVGFGCCQQSNIQNGARIFIIIFLSSSCHLGISMKSTYAEIYLLCDSTYLNSLLISKNCITFITAP